jgi:hypothetical protein
MIHRPVSQWDGDRAASQIGIPNVPPDTTFC